MMTALPYNIVKHYYKV